MPVTLTTPGTSWPWNPTVHVLLRRAYFSQHNVVKARPCGSVGRDFLPFPGRLVLRGVCTPQPVYPFIRRIGLL